LPHPADYMTPDGRVLVKAAVPSGSAMLGDFGIEAEVRTF